MVTQKLLSASRATHNVLTPYPPLPPTNQSRPRHVWWVHHIRFLSSATAILFSNSPFPSKTSANFPNIWDQTVFPFSSSSLPPPQQLSPPIPRLASTSQVPGFTLPLGTQSWDLTKYGGRVGYVGGGRRVARGLLYVRKAEDLCISLITGWCFLLFLYLCSLESFLFHFRLRFSHRPLPSTLLGYWK